MPEMRRFALTDLLLLLLVLAVAAGTRVGYLIACADSGRGPGPLRVQQGTPPEERESLLRSLAQGGSFRGVAPLSNGQEEETAHVSPGYPWLLAQMGRIVGAESRDRGMRWLQAGLGALTAMLYFLFARRTFRSLALATVVGLLAAVHPFWVIDTAALENGVLAAFLMGLSLFLAVLSSQTEGPLASLLLGLTLAALALVQAPLLPFAFIALAWFLLRSRVMARGWLCALVAFLGFVIGLTPWTVYNLQRFGEPFPIVDSAYFHLWAGNDPEADGGPPTSDQRGTIPGELTGAKNQPDRYARLGRLYWNEIRQHPDRFLQLRLRAGLAFFLGEHWLREGQLAEPTGQESGIPGWLSHYDAVLQGTLLFVFLLALLGWRWTYVHRFDARPLALALIWVPLPYLLSHGGALSGPRLPLDGVLLCFAAFALVRLATGWQRNDESELPKSEG